MALNSLIYADVLLRNCSLTHSNNLFFAESSVNNCLTSRIELLATEIVWGYVIFPTAVFVTSGAVIWWGADRISFTINCLNSPVA